MAESVSSTLALFADPEVAMPFLLWVLRLLANIRAMSASISTTKEDRHSLEIELQKRESFGTNLGWSEGCRDAKMGMTRRMPKAEKDAREERNSQEEGRTEETPR